MQAHRFLAECGLDAIYMPITEMYSKYDAFRSWRPNGICANLVNHPPATSSARSATGCVARGLGFLPTTSHTRDDETRRIDGSVHDMPITGRRHTDIKQKLDLSICAN